MADVKKGKDNPEGIVHEYDGIQEADNALPNWWLAILFGSIAFGALYWLSAEAFKTTPSPLTAYREEMDQIAKQEAEKMKALGTVDDASLAAMAKNAKTLEDGKTVFAQNCVACHGVNAGGVIGPNLTDEFWLHGGTPTKIYATIKDGYAAKGMPAWGPQLGEERVRLAAAYVLSLKNTKVAGGKAPQGDPEP